MTSPREQALADLRQSIDTLPERTRRAMLSGLGTNTVIAGAFTDGNGACPMLLAHRNGGRANCMTFPEAWDRFTGVHGRNIARPATQQEVLHLRMQLEESLTAPVASSSGLAEAIADHHAAVDARNERREAQRSRTSGGFVADLANAIDEHRSTARERRNREATEVGLDWLFDETLVLPEDFGREDATEPEPVEADREAVAAGSFDFSREPDVAPEPKAPFKPTVIPPRREPRPVLK